MSEKVEVIDKLKVMLSNDTASSDAVQVFDYRRIFAVVKCVASGRYQNCMYFQPAVLRPCVFLSDDNLCLFNGAFGNGN